MKSSSKSQTSGYPGISFTKKGCPNVFFNVWDILGYPGFFSSIFLFLGISQDTFFKYCVFWDILKFVLDIPKYVLQDWDILFLTPLMPWGWCRTSGAGPAAPAPPAITSVPVPAPTMISLTSSPSLQKLGDLPTWMCRSGLCCTSGGTTGSAAGAAGYHVCPHAYSNADI